MTSPNTVRRQGWGPNDLLPGEKVTFTEAWDQLGNDGKAVAPGTYTVRAFIAAATDRGPLTMEKRLEIVP